MTGAAPSPRYRILMLAPTGFFADYGCHVRIQGHALALQARGHSVRIVTYPGGRDVAGLHTIRPPGWPRGREMPVGSAWRKVALDAALTPTAWLAVRRFRPHLIHAYLHEGALIGALLARLYRLPLVFDFQGSLVGEMLDHRFLSRRSPLLKVLQPLERWIDRQPRALLASSHHAAGLLAAQFGVPAARLHVLPDSVDVQRFRPRPEQDSDAVQALRQRLHLPPQRPVVVYLGLLAPYQGTETLLQAIALLHQQQPTPRPFFLIMGFPDVERYRRLAAGLGIGDDVHFSGPVPYAEAPLWLALGDVAVAPKRSQTEGSGKLLPYMAAALPTVASDMPVHREYLGGDGCYFPPGDPQGLAAALARVLAMPDRAAIGLRLRQRAAAHYTWEQAAAQIERVYRQIAAGRTA